MNLEGLIPWITLAGGALGWALNEARRSGRQEGRLDGLMKGQGSAEATMEELLRSKNAQGRRLGWHDDRLVAIETLLKLTPPEKPPET